MSVIADPELRHLLEALHAKSDEQAALVRAFEAQRDGAEHPPSTDEIRAFRSDKLVALDRDKAEFCYQLCRAKKALRIVEVGTSYGVSTIYLAAAVRDNVQAFGGDGVVIGTEYEASKAAAARGHFAQAGLSSFVDLREGDLRVTLKQISGSVDFVSSIFGSPWRDRRWNWLRRVLHPVQLWCVTTRRTVELTTRTISHFSTIPPTASGP
jgi:predicted O-methyltransferase YrrM